MSQLSSLKRDESNGYFFHPLSEENIVLNLMNFVDDAGERLFSFEQRFSDYLTTKKVSLPSYWTGSSTYKHKHCGSKFFMGDETSERELKLHPPLAEMSKEELDAQVNQQKTQFHKIFESIISKMMIIKDIFLLEIFLKVLRDNLSEGYFRSDLKEVEKVVKGLLLKVINDAETFETALENIKIEEWKKYLPEKNILVIQAVAHNFNSSSCRLVHFYVIQRNLAEYLYKKLSEVSSKFSEVLKDAFEKLDPQLRFQFKKLVFLELIQERYITGEILTPLKLEEVESFEEVRKSLQEEDYIITENDKIILTAGQREKIPEMINITKEKRQALIREFLNTSVDLNQYVLSSPETLIQEKTEQKSGTQNSLLPEISEVKKSEIIIGSDKLTQQWGVIGKTEDSMVILDLNSPHIVFVCGKMGAGKGYTIGVICEMLASTSIQNLSNVQKKATIIVLYNPREDTPSEFGTIQFPNDVKEEVETLQKEYGVSPQKLIRPEDFRVFIDPFIYEKAAKKFKKEYNTEYVYPIYVDPSSLTGNEWAIVLSASEKTDRLYVKRIFDIIEKRQFEPFSLDIIRNDLKNDTKLDRKQKNLADQRLSILENYLRGEERNNFIENLAIGGVNIFDFRKTIRTPDDLFSVMTLILSVLQTKKGLEDETFIFVINEAHDYFKGNISEEFIRSIEYLIRRKRHGANWLLLDTHFPDDVDDKVIKLADVKIIHFLDKAVGSRILKEVFGDMTKEFSNLDIGKAIISADSSSIGKFEPIKVNIRPRVTKHGAPTKTTIKV